MTKTANDIDITGYILPLAQAVVLAEQNGWRQRVLAYITRQNHELLVFTHPPRYPEAGIQVPAGGLESGETPQQGAIREVYEETGLTLPQAVHLASYHWTRAGQSQIWHYCWLPAPPDTLDQWTHVVSGGADDQGMTFTHRFVPVDQHGLIPNYHYEEALLALKEAIQAASGGVSYS